MQTRRLVLTFSILTGAILVAVAGIERFNLVGKTAYAIESASLDAQFDHVNEIMSADVAPLEQISRGFSIVSDAAKPSVVFIDALSNKVDDRLRELLQERDLQIPPSRGTGSGVIFDAAGYIVTNNHVIADSNVVRVTLDDGRKINANVIGADPKTDLAVIKIEANNLHPARFGDSDKVKVGHLVLAIGAPFRLGHSVTHGIISAIGRSDVNVDIEYQDWFQTDAAINPGNSGGPLINTRGEVIGLNTAIATESGANQGVAFAIPSNTIKRIVEKLKTGREIVRGYLGVQIEPVDPNIARAYNYDRAAGVFIKGVGDNTPAMKAGMQPEDIVVRINDRVVVTREKMQHMIAAIDPGTSVNITVWRKGHEIVLPTIIGAQPDGFRTLGTLRDLAPAPGSRNERSNTMEPMRDLESNRRSRSLNRSNDDGPARVFRDLGFEASTVTPELSRKYNLPEDIINGVVITRVYPTGHAYESDLRPGNVLVRVNDRPVHNIAELEEHLNSEELRKGLRLKLRVRVGSDYQDFYTVLTSR